MPSKGFEIVSKLDFIQTKHAKRREASASSGKWVEHEQVFGHEHGIMILENNVGAGVSPSQGQVHPKK